MTSTVESMPVAARSPFPWGLTVASTLIAAATIAMIWLVAVPWGPLVCPAVYPAPTNCFESHRAGTGVIATIGVSAIYLATMLLALSRRARRGSWALAGFVLLVLAPVASYLSVAWLPGFTS